MRHTTYLNAILTVNALLLAGLLWTRVADTPVLSQNAAAAPEQSPAGSTDNFTNSNTRQQQMLEATNQMRQQTVDAMHRIENKMEATTRLLQSGQLKVQVTNLKDIQVSESHRQE